MRKNILKYFLLLSSLFCIAYFSGCAKAPRYKTIKVDKPGEKPVEKARGFKQKGYASYYGRKYHGKTTSSGEVFDMNKLTAAHRSLPFNTKVKVTNEKNKKSVVVKINDRGPFVKGRIIDLSYGAAKKIDMVREGVIKVKLEVVR